MNLPARLLTITYLVVRTFASGTGETALGGFEQSEGDDAELAHSMQVRAHIPRFIGKRTLDDEAMENFLLKEQEKESNEDFRNALMYLLKNYDDSLFEQQSHADDISPQEDQQAYSDISTFERNAKWAPRFVGKRRSPMFVGRRRAPLFVGKRYAPRFIGKRGAPMFVGRRGSPMFVGRRDSPLFIGRRENALPADTSFFIGGKRSVATNNLKQSQISASLGFPKSDYDLEMKTDREKDDLSESDAVERAFQISANLLTTPDNEHPLEIPYLTNVKYLNPSRDLDFKPLAFSDSELGENLGQDERKGITELTANKNKKYAEFLGKRMSQKYFLNDTNRKRAYEFLGKRYMEFLGKRDLEPQNKRSMEFIGKRAMEFLGKRAMEFLGKRNPTYKYRGIHVRRAGDWIG